MRETKCEVIRRELDDLMLDQEFSTAAAEHLETCSDCREFQRQQTKLRQIVGSLGTVNAPADFDFRLRARLAADSERTPFQYWTFASKGLATAVVILLFGVGVVVVRQRMNQPGPVEVAVKQEEPAQQEQPKPIESSTGQTSKLTAAVAVSGSKSRIERAAQTGSKVKRSLVAVDFSKEGASVITSSGSREVDTAVFPIEASLQSLKVSLDDGQGNARTISVPMVSFGSQRVLASRNQFAPKDVW